MTRFLHIYFPRRLLVLLFVETFIILGAFVVALYIHFGADINVQLVDERGVLKILIAAIVCMLCMHYYDLYGAFLLSGAAQMIARVVQVLGTSCVLLALIYYLYPPLRISLELAVLWVILTVICLVLSRGFFVALTRSQRMTQKGVLLGRSPLARTLHDEIRARPEFGLMLTGYITSQPDEDISTELPCLGSAGTLSAVVAREGITHVVLVAPRGRDTLSARKRQELKTRGVIIEDGFGLYEAISGKVCPDSLDPDSSFRITRRMLIYKRSASILFASLGLVIALPIIILAIIAIRIESSGSAIFRQRRVGKGGRLFTLYKLRTMYDGAEQDGNFKPAQAQDERCTKVGKWLRRVHIDELPQLFNILRDDMHLIGPRPCAQNMEEECAAKIPFYGLRWTVKPGATGWAQVRRGYCATLEDNIDRLGYDLFYIKNMSAGLDLAILFETVKILVLGRGGR